MLRPDDTLRIFTSPYRRTRETTEGILSSLTATSDESGPSPFSRDSIKVYEEPRLREQDFGNFQPCSTEMERMWQERADYGHFFYRIPNGESAADAYDRISGFNESLWRGFSEEDFPSVCVLVTHGLMTRVFLMKWYHWSVEYFEDLRNINHCEFVIMNQDPENGKYVLENKLRTWSEMKRRATITSKPSTPMQSAAPSSPALAQMSSPSIPARKWGGCVGGCNHDHSNYPRQVRRPTLKDKDAVTLPPSATQESSNEKEDHPVASQETKAAPTKSIPALSPTSQTLSHTSASLSLPLRPSSIELRGRDAGGTLSGAATPMGERDGFGFGSTDTDEQGSRDHTDNEQHDTHTPLHQSLPRKKKPRRRPTQEDLEDWARQSGMGSGARADALGDEPEDESDDGHDGAEAVGETSEQEKQFGYQIEEDVGPKNERVKEIERMEKQDQSLEGSVY